MINFQQRKGKSLEIYYGAQGVCLWDISHMAKAPKDEAAKAVARALYSRLLKIQPEGMSANEWMREAGVSNAFLTNMAKKGSIPSVANLEAVLKVAGYTMAEFYLVTDMPDATRARLIDLLRQMDPETVDAMLKLAEKTLATKAA